MRRFIIVQLLMLALCVTSAFGDESHSPTKPADLEALVKSLTAKLVDLEKRLAAVEEENKSLREAIVQPRVHVIQAPQQKDQDQPKFRLLKHTEIGVPFDVERAMLGDKARLRAYEPDVFPKR